MIRIIAPLSLLSLVLVSSRASAGTFVTNQYQSRGVIISNNFIANFGATRSKRELV